MSTRTDGLRPGPRLGSWAEAAPARSTAAPSESSTALLLVLATTALGVALFVARLVDAQVNGEYAVTFRTLWWLMLAFNVVDAFVQRTRLDAWNTLLLKYMMVGMTYSILV